MNPTAPASVSQSSGISNSHGKLGMAWRMSPKLRLFASFDNFEQVAGKHDEARRLECGHRHIPVAGRILRVADGRGEQMHLGLALGGDKRLVGQGTSLRMKRL